MQFLFVFFFHIQMHVSGPVTPPFPWISTIFACFNPTLCLLIILRSFSPFSFYKRKHPVQGKCQWIPATVLTAPLPFLSPMILLCFPLIPSTTQTTCCTYPMMYWCPAWWARHVNRQVITGLLILLHDQKYCWNTTLQILSFMMMFHHLPEFLQNSCQNSSSERTSHILFLLCPFELRCDSVLSGDKKKENNLYGNIMMTFM